MICIQSISPFWIAFAEFGLAALTMRYSVFVLASSFHIFHFWLHVLE